MKRLFKLFLYAFVIMICFTGCAKENSVAEENNKTITIIQVNVEKDSGETYTERRISKASSVEGKKINSIGDSFFIEATNDVYYNLKEYLGKAISIQGYVDQYIGQNGDVCYAVVRNTPGCCGADGLAGLDIRCAGEYPNTGLWVEATGIVETDPYSRENYPVIFVSEIKETEITVPFVTN